MSFVEVQFKGNRRAAFANTMAFPVKLGDWVVVQADKGEDYGRVVQITDEDRLSGEDERRFVRPLLRKAGPHDLQRHQRNLQREDRAEEIGRELVRRHRLAMKVVNVEYQLDGKKVTFFFTAEGRIDFRNLVKDLAGELRTRIDLRQIGARDEARKFGGFGPCGQRQCCSGWLSRFDPVTTSMAKEQNLPPNPVKLSGNCGRLKCCLRYELQFYREELRRYPPADRPIRTLQGLAFIEKVDIFGEEVVIRYEGGEIETHSRERLEQLMDFEPGENHCDSGCGHSPEEVRAGLAAPAAPPAGREDAPAGDPGRLVAVAQAPGEGAEDSPAGDDEDRPGQTDEGDGERLRKRRGRRGGRRGRRSEEGGAA
jgi:cell fate regulator YaaT (PSP1 superfamily)